MFRAALPVPPEQDLTAAARYFLQVVANPALTWNDLAFLRRHTRMPILLKGILHPDDARRAADWGADGIIVSNHGGRQVEGAVAALDCLPAVVDALARQTSGQPAVLFDSGVRRGADVFKALALGAPVFCWAVRTVTAWRSAESRASAKWSAIYWPTRN